MFRGLWELRNIKCKELNQMGDTTQTLGNPEFTWKQLEELSAAVSGCICRGLSAEEERVKEHLAGTGEGRTSGLLKYSWGFLHFNLLLFKRWLFPSQTAPEGKEIPCSLAELD